jgi:hypothetical protein
VAEGAVSTQATKLALEHLLCSVGDPIGELNDIAPGHPEFNRAQTLRAAAGILAKVPHTRAAIKQAVRSADLASASKRTRAHLTAAEAWLAGNPILAAESYVFILKRWPHDLLALRLAESCYFFLGDHDRLCAVVDDVLPAWSEEEDSFKYVLALAAFAHAEKGDVARAEELGRQALARNPSCPFGVHAMAHAFAESGRPAEAAQWMRDQSEQWECESGLRTHNAWHLAMFDVEAGNPASALEVLDTWLLPATAASTLDACDATALLWRLMGDGVDVGARWGRVSDAFEHTVAPGFWPFIDLHAALAHRIAGRHDRAQRLSLAVARCAKGSDYAALRARHITQPALLGLGAFADGRYDEVAAVFAGLRPIIGYAGGSRVQMELFASVEREAVRRQTYALARSSAATVSASSATDGARRISLS